MVKTTLSVINSALGCRRLQHQHRSNHGHRGHDNVPATSAADCFFAFEASPAAPTTTLLLVCIIILRFYVLEKVAGWSECIDAGYNSKAVA